MKRLLYTGLWPQCSFPKFDPGQVGMSNIHRVFAELKVKDKFLLREIGNFSNGLLQKVLRKNK